MKLRKVDFRLVTALVILLAAAGVVATRVTAFRKQVLNTPADKLSRHEPAPEFAGISTWINTEPLTMLQLRGKVVLIDFWTYSCVNCIRTLRELKGLYRVYRSSGLEIVGVHSPEFNFEKDESNVRKAVEKNAITWPVAMDNSMDTWDAFGNQYWPHVYLIDKEGSIRFDHIGEGGSDEIEGAVRALLAGKGVTLPKSAGVPAYEVPTSLTPEIYLGFDRGEQGDFLGNGGGYTHDREHDYVLPSKANIAAATRPAFYLGGSWLARGEFVAASGVGAKIVLPFNARNVFVVAGAGEGNSSATIKVELDGAPVSKSAAYSRVVDGVLTIEGKDLYQILSLSGVEQHTLTLTIDEPGTQIYTFTFG